MPNGELQTVTPLAALFLALAYTARAVYVTATERRNGKSSRNGFRDVAEAILRIEQHSAETANGMKDLNSKMERLLGRTDSKG